MAVVDVAPDLDTRVRSIVAAVAKLDDPAQISLDADLYRDVGVKSTAALDLLLSLEETFSISIPDEAFGDARTVRALVALIGELC